MIIKKNSSILCFMFYVFTVDDGMNYNGAIFEIKVINV